MADCTYPKCQQTAIPGCQGLCRDLSVNRRATDGQRAGVPEGAFIPRTAHEMVEFIGSNYDTMQADAWTQEEIQRPAGDLNNVRYSLTVHDLLSAFQWAGLLDAPTPPAGDIPTDSIDRLTREKAAHIIARDGFQVSGVVMTKPNGRVCIVDKSAVRWMDSQELFRVMHPDAPPAGDAGQERDRRDAERFRWLIDESGEFVWYPPGYNGAPAARFDFLWHSEESDIRKAVDAAIAASKEEKVNGQ